VAKTELVRIGGVWKQKSHSTGVVFQRGSVAVEKITLTRGEKILIFWNKKKSSDNSPDYNMFVEREVQEPPEDEDDFGSESPPFDGAGGDDDQGGGEVPF
jgi:hypothetical protein